MNDQVAESVRRQVIEICERQAGERRVVKLRRLRQLVDLSRSQIYELMASKKFPQCFPYGPKSNAWDYDEVQSWLTERMACKGVRQAPVCQLKEAA